MSGLTNWFSQIFAVAVFNLRSIPERKGAAIAAAAGIAGVVGVLVGVLAIAEGFRRTMTVSGAPDVAVVLRTGADSELTSGLSREEVRLISDGPGIARTAQGPVASAELFVIIDLPKRSTGTGANVPLRGVESQAFDVRGNIEMARGRRFESGKNEIVVGVGAAREFAGLDLGQDIRIGQNMWNVVGIFSAGGGVAESEIWSDAAVLQPAYNRNDNFQAVYAKLTSAS
ncbi:MAG: ABC transporter permease, partial [Verrucomicrobiota bacterium]|nr:ABC transporter permease [Verrucomicrobiota bacterium]